VLAFKNERSEGEVNARRLIWMLTRLFSGTTNEPPTLAEVFNRTSPDEASLVERFPCEILYESRKDSEKLWTVLDVEILNVVAGFSGL
jgi:hypothetical protein